MNPSESDISAVALSAVAEFKRYAGKRLPFCGLAKFKSSTSSSDFVYNNVHNLHEEDNFEGDKESFWDCCRFRIKYTNQ